MSLPKEKVKFYLVGNELCLQVCFSDIVWNWSCLTGLQVIFRFLFIMSFSTEFCFYFICFVYNIITLKYYYTEILCV